MSGILGTAVTGSAGAYTVNNSLRFRSSASAYLNRTFGSPTNNTTWTLSSWIKRGALGAYMPIIDTSSRTIYLDFTDNKITLHASGVGPVAQSTAVFRDPSAHAHIVIRSNAGVFTIYWNNQSVLTYTPGTSFSEINSAVAHNLFARPSSSQYYDGLVSEVNFIDGQALTPSSFGETNASTGVWQPKAYTGTYGTNGFYLKFSDIATTSGSNSGLGKDFSGNGNYWNTNNISVTSGSTYDAMTDSPTPASSTVGNFATFNPIDQISMTVLNGNLSLSSAANTSDIVATLGIAPNSGKFYWEYIPTAYSQYQNIGVCGTSRTDGYGWGQLSTSWVYRFSDGNKRNNGTASAYGATVAVNDVVGVAYDSGTGQLTFYKNNVSQGVAFTISTTDFIFPAFGFSTAFTTTSNVNFGQQPFVYTPPNGYVRLQTYNLPTPTIGASSTTLANKYFDATLWTGDGTNGRAITNAGSFQPDLVWAKARSSAIDHWLTNSTTGASKQLSSDLTDAEATYNLLSSFNSNGFSVNGGTYSGTNQNGTTYVGWQWKANGGTTSSNTNGSITSTVQANTTSGFSVATFTPPASGTSFTVGHGLGLTPKMIITKIRNNGAANWFVYHQAMGNTGYMALNATNGNLGPFTGAWNNTSPTSSVATFGSYWIGSSYNMVAYFFADVAGFSKLGSYTGNGSTSNDGPFVYTGFLPRFIMGKRTDSTGGWWMFDTARNTYNLADDYFYANLSDAEFTNITTLNIDILSNGFKVRAGSSPSGFINANGGTYIYMAFAESPFNYSLAR